MFGDQKLRLMRTKWADANELAEELYAIFGAVDAQPVELQGPVTIVNANSSEPALTTDPGDDGNGAIRVPGRGGTIDIGGDNFTFVTVINQTIINEGGGGGDGTGFATVPGKILSGGPGLGPYSVQIYPNGLTFASKVVAAKCLQLAVSETIPANTWGLVSQTTDGYYFQVPVWLAPAP